jgi:conjugal transfer pilus assembly protein TraB
MDTPSFFAQKKQEWQDMDVKFRAALIAICVFGTGAIVYKQMTRQEPTPTTVTALPTAGATSVQPGASTQNPQSFPGVLPTSTRNQGLEDLTIQIRSLSDKIAALERAPGSGSPGTGTQMGNVTVVSGPKGASAPNATGASNDPDTSHPAGASKDLPPAVNFDQPVSGQRAASSSPSVPSEPVVPEPPPRPVMIADPVKQEVIEDSEKRPDLVLPKYTGIEAVMLTGMNAMPSGSNGGAAGDVKKMEEVGAPFVSRVKGLAIMPNSWKTSDLQNCFIGGGAVAVISAERAYATSQSISCIFSKGEVYEGKINAYAVDIDGTLGLAGRVVNKQGTMLMQSALSGMAAGLGSALSPQAVPSYNSNTQNGQQQSFTLPNPAYLAGTAVGQGINHAAAQLSKFYLDFAKETFPVVEVTAGTRVTWILREAVVLKKRNENKEAQK